MVKKYFSKNQNKIYAAGLLLFFMLSFLPVVLAQSNNYLLDGAVNKNTTKSVTANKLYYIDGTVQDARLIEKAAFKTEDTTFHLFSHGRPGELFLDGQWLQKEGILSFIKNQELLNSTILYLNIYSCNFAKGEKGKQAVAYLENELAIAIAASTNITGKDGNWKLEIGQVRYYHSCKTNRPEAKNINGTQIHFFS